MSKKALALVGSTGLFLCTTLLTAPVASAAPAGAATTAAAGLDFTALLAPVSANKVKGSGELWVTLTGNSAKFTLQVGGLVAGLPHAAHIYADAKGCPTTASTNNGQRSVSLANATSQLGSVTESLTTSGDTTASSALALDRYPTAGDYTYSRTFDISPDAVAAIKDGTAVMVIHGVDYNGNKKYDNVLGSTGGVANEATAPALCGSFVASQMASVPTGSADTGGGPSDSAASTVRNAGVLALLGSFAAAVVAFRRRPASPSSAEVVTNGSRRNQ